MLLCLLLLLSCRPLRPAEEAEGVLLPVIMYHSVLKDPRRTGMYVITPDSLRADLCFLKDAGYTTVLPEDLYAYTAGGELPPKPVMLTFDDGHYNNLTYVLPLLEEFNMKAVIFVVGRYAQEFTDHPDPNPNYAYLSWPDVSSLLASGLVDVGCHSFDMHRQGPRLGSSRMQGEGESAYRQAFLADVDAFQQAAQKNAGFWATAYAYPFGAVGAGTGQMLLEAGFGCTFTCREKVNCLTRNPESLLGLGRFNRSGREDTARFMAKLGVAKSASADIISSSNRKGQRHGYL